MIVNCENCNKNFLIQDNLISKKGRLLECGNCQHRWFFKPVKEDIYLNLNEKVLSNDLYVNQTNLQSITNDSQVTTKEYKNQFINHEKQENNNNRGINRSKSKKKKEDFLKKSLNKFFIFIISFIALILIFDTFKLSISIILPGIIPFLENLYSTLKDLQLFIKDLFN